MTGDHVALSGGPGGDGVTVKFKAITGHTKGDRWVIAAFPPSKIDFGQGQMLLEDKVLSATDLSTEGIIQLESGIDLRLESGSSQDLFISANTTTISINGPVVTTNAFAYSTETVTATNTAADAARAVSVNTVASFLNSSANTSALTMSAGAYDGQIKQITMITAGNAMTMTRANGNLNATSVPTSIVFDAVGESATLIYQGSSWYVTSSTGATIS